MRLQLKNIKNELNLISQQFLDRKMESFNNDEEAQKYVEKFEKILLFIEHNQSKIEWFIRIALKYKFLFKWFKK